MPLNQLPGADAGFQIEAQYGDWHRRPITTASPEIITIARNNAVPPTTSD